MALLLTSMAITVAGCDPGSGAPQCVPACRAGTRCSLGECVPVAPAAMPDLEEQEQADLAIDSDLGDPIDLAADPDLTMLPDLAGRDLIPHCNSPCCCQTPYCAQSGQCVACLVDNHCPIGQVCRALGQSNLCVPGCADDSRCGFGRKCCGGVCSEVDKDVSNCGACGHVCTAPNASGACRAGQCELGACDPGWGDCNRIVKDGCETTLVVDPRNCGFCGNACAKGVMCLNGVCN